MPNGVFELPRPEAELVREMHVEVGVLDDRRAEAEVRHAYRSKYLATVAVTMGRARRMTNWFVTRLASSESANRPRPGN